MRNPNGTTGDDLEPMRRIGHGDAEIVAMTAFVALRLAWSTVNDALGVRPDVELGTSVPSAVQAAISWGRPVSDR